MTSAIMQARGNAARSLRVACAVLAAPFVLIPVMLIIGALEISNRVGSGLARMESAKRKRAKGQ